MCIVPSGFLVISTKGDEKSLIASLPSVDGLVPAYANVSAEQDSIGSVPIEPAHTVRICGSVISTSVSSV